MPAHKHCDVFYQLVGDLILVGEQNSKREKNSKTSGWSQMNSTVKWHFPEYKFDMK